MKKPKKKKEPKTPRSEPAANTASSAVAESASTKSKPSKGEQKKAVVAEEASAGLTSLQQLLIAKEKEISKLQKHIDKQEAKAATL